VGGPAVSIEHPSEVDLRRWTDGRAGPLAALSNAAAIANGVKLLVGRDGGHGVDLSSQRSRRDR